MSVTLKRKKMEHIDGQIPGIQTVIRSDIWYDDGSIVLQAKFQQFRVHRSVLSSKSLVLKGLMAQCSDLEVEGCKVLLLTDSPRDVRHLLQAIYDRSYFSDKVSQPFECVVALLRLGKKYEMQNLYDEALDCLKAEYPATHGIDNNWTRIPYHNGIFFDTINLARELGIRSVLPRCFFYITLEHTTQEIFDGVRRDDGSLAILPLKDQRAYILALSSMQCAQAEHMFTWLEQASIGCTSPVDCIKTKHEFFVRLWRPPGQNVYLDWDSSWEKGLCMTCVKTGKTSHEAGSRRFWDLLPTFFGLPDWKDLTP